MKAVAALFEEPDDFEGDMSGMAAYGRTDDMRFSAHFA
jgi:hypothetical protein